MTILQSGKLNQNWLIKSWVTYRQLAVLKSLESWRLLWSLSWDQLKKSFVYWIFLKNNFTYFCEELYLPASCWAQIWRRLQVPWRTATDEPWQCFLVQREQTFCVMIEFFIFWWNCKHQGRVSKNFNKHRSDVIAGISSITSEIHFSFKSFGINKFDPKNGDKNCPDSEETPGWVG